MNSEQIKSLVRQAMLFIAGIIGGTTFVSKFFTVGQVTAILTSDTVTGVIVSLVTGGIASAWALISRSNKNLALAAEQVPAVAGVIMKPTEEGREIAATGPPAVAVAGTKAAEKVVEGAVP